MPDDCRSCPVAAIVERREFVRDMLAALAALPVSFGAGRGMRTDKAYPIPTDDAVVIDKAESVIIARFQNKAYAFSLACPHQNTALRWLGAKNRFQCPKHESKYQPDGTFIDGRATRSMDRFAVRREGEQLMVNLDMLYEADKDVAEWKAAFVSL